MKFEEFKNAIKEKYAEYFKGFCAVRKYKCLGKSILIDCYMGGVFTGNRPDNDMLKAWLNINLPDSFNYETDDLPEKLVMTAHNSYYLIEPEEKHVVFSSRKIPYRKTTGTPEKLIAAAGKFFERAYNLIRQDYNCGNIPNIYEEVVEWNMPIVKEDRFNYQLLDRYRCDCEYYLGNGNRQVKHLYGESVQDHIRKMKEIYERLPVKPVWLSMEKIQEYESRMEN